MKSQIFAAVAASALMGVTVADAQVQISSDGRPAHMSKIKPVKGLNSMDRKFVDQIANAHNYEIILARLGAEKGSSSWVKDFAREMIKEHELANADLHLLCDEKGIECRGELTAKMKNKIEYLRRLSGTAFDNAWREEQLAAHASASNMLKKQIKNGHDADVRNYAVTYLPPTIHHYKLAMTRQTMTGANKAGHGM